MGIETHAPVTARDQVRLLTTLECLLEIDALDVDSALNQACQSVAEALGSDKVDAFLYDPDADRLVARGTSDTPMGRREHEIGMEVLPIANGGRVVEVFLTGTSYATGRADLDREELRGFTQGLGVRSEISVPLEVGGTRRGVLMVASAAPEAFSADDARFCAAVAHWVGVAAHRAELIQQRQAAAAEEGRRMAAEELIRVLAHDLNNLIAPLKGRIDLIRRRGALADPQTIIAHADEASRSVERLRRFVGDLLDAERLERGAFALTPCPADLAVLAQDIATVFSSGGVEVRVQATEPVVALIDSDRLRQALENVVSNAIRYSPVGGAVTLVLSTEKREGRGWAVLTVTDQGPGIAPEVLPRLFDRFAAGPESSGLGLGLYIASRIAAAHGGSITAHSLPGQGATFRLVLPLGDAGAP